MHVRWGDQCNINPSCSQTDTLAEANACMASNPVEQQKDQYSGWDWNDPPDSICSTGYNFQPNWTVCSSTWQADWQGYINLTQGGNHCFDVLGGNNEACASIFFDTQTTGVTHASGPMCYMAPAGAYPIRWYYQMDNGSGSDMHIAYCFGGAGTCTPSVAIPATMLRVSP
jgi:hypothetical protein